MRVPFFSTYIAGPVAALLPQRWRRAWPNADRVHWGRAAALSGFLELAAGVTGLAYWYMQSMTRMVNAAIDWALEGKFGGAVTEQQIGGAALAVFATHPLTWLLAYAFAEGAVRLIGGAFTDDVLGTFPLYLLERTIFLVKHRKELRSNEDLQRKMASLVEGMRVQAIEASSKKLPDEIRFSRDGGHEFLEIWASRRKEDWVAPKVVRVDDVYYRLEHSSRESGARPFLYRLRRLEAGVPGRNVIVYQRGRTVAKQN